ncbi:MAG: ABC transporter substrate-binding protein [Planctomycetota bacterium]
MSPSIALLLTQLGLEEHIVGRHGFDTFLESDVAIVGDQAGIDYERLARVRPTHILLEWGSRDLPARLTRLASEHDWEIRDFQLLELDDLGATLGALGEMFDAKERASGLIARLDEALAPLPEGTFEGFDVLPMYWTSPLGVAGPESFHAQMLVRLGLTLAVSDGPAYIEMESEDVARLDPGIVILFMPDASEQAIHASLERLDELSSAVETGWYIIVDDPTSLSLSARIADIASQIKIELLAMEPD